MQPTKHRRERQRRVEREVARFRAEATALRLPLRLRWRYWWNYLGLARRGTMAFSETEDAVYEDSRWKRGYERACARLNAFLAERGRFAGNVAIPTYEHGELEVQELRQLMRRQVPFLLRGGARDLPISGWTLETLEQTVGNCEVPINEAADQPSTDVDRPTKAHHYYAFRRGRLREVIGGIRAGRYVRTTTAEDVMHHDDGRLREDLGLPWWEQVTGWDRNQHHWLRSRLMVGKIVGAQMLLQPENAFTLWHAEPGDNFFVLAQGVKNWSLAHPCYTAAMKPRVKSTTNYHGSSIDIRESEDVLEQRGFSGYLAIPKVQFQMEPGDVLRIPNHWWHTVVTEPGSYTVGVSIRSIGTANRTCVPYTILRNLDAQYHAMARAFAQEGRIRDQHIGYPRRSRSESAS